MVGRSGDQVGEIQVRESDDGNLARHSGGEGAHSTGDAIQLLVDTPYVPDES